MPKRELQRANFFQPPCGRPVDEIRSASHADLARYFRRLRLHLVRSGRKLTAQREMILKSIITSAPHLDSKGLVQWVATEYPEASTATIYRCIKLLCDAHILRESFYGPLGLPVYELADRFPATAHHGQIICLQCGHIFRFHDPRIQVAQASVMRERQFRQVNHRNVLYGVCKLLQRSRKALVRRL